MTIQHWLVPWQWGKGLAGVKWTVRERAHCSHQIHLHSRIAKPGLPRWTSRLCVYVMWLKAGNLVTLWLSFSNCKPPTSQGLSLCSPNCPGTRDPPASGSQVLGSQMCATVPGEERVFLARCSWLTPVILATQEAEIRRIEVQSQLGANSSRDPTLKKPSQKRAGGVAQVVECLPSKCQGPEFKPQYCQK
jgi:hypothetical protein